MINSTGINSTGTNSTGTNSTGFKNAGNPLRLLLWAPEVLLNRLIRNDSHIDKQLRRFAGKTLGIQARSPTLSLLLLFDSGRIQLSAQDATALGISVDAWVSGKLTDLLGLLRADAGSRALANKAIQLSGDVELTQDLFHTLQQLDLDWEDYLAPVFGDVATHEAGKAGQRLTDFISQSGQRLNRSLEDYLKEETRAVPHHHQRQQFSDALDELKLQLDRADARRQGIQARLDTLSD